MAARNFSFEAIGTKWSIDIESAVTEGAWKNLQSDVSSRIGSFDKTYSRFRGDSWVIRLSRKAGKHKLPEDALPLLEFYRQLYDATGGLITPLIGQTISDAGYDATYSLTSKALHKPPKWDDVLDYTEEELTMKQPALLDFGAAGKGYLIDIVGDYLTETGVSDYVIDAGGDILQHTDSNASIEIGLENPFDTSQAIGIVHLQNRSICASAGSRRAWGNYNHIISPQSLTSPTEVTATWVVANDALHADGLATALFFTRPEILKQKFEFEYAILDKDRGLAYSTGLDIILFETTA